MPRNQSLNNWGFIFMIWSFFAFAFGLILLALTVFETLPYDGGLKVVMIATMIGVALATTSIILKIAYWRSK